MCAFHFSHFLITGLCNSLANCWFGIILFSIAVLSSLSGVSGQVRVTELPKISAPEDFLLKICKLM